MFLTLGISSEKLLQNSSVQSFLLICNLNLFKRQATLPMAPWYVQQKSPPLSFLVLKISQGLWTLLILIL